MLDAPSANDDTRREALRTAVALYAGDLLDGSDDEWLREERERLRRRHLEALSELTELCEAVGELDEAAAVAERLLSEDPLREDVHRALIRVHAARGDRASGVRAYHRCATILERELGVEPSGATQWAYREVLASDPGERLQPGAALTTGRPPLVGRTAERAALIAAWRAAAAGAPRLVLVCGEAGIGKTQLVEELCAWCARRGALTLEARCYAAEGPLAYGPVVDWLRDPAMRPALARLDRARLTDLARLLPELLDEIRTCRRPVRCPSTSSGCAFSTR